MITERKIHAQFVGCFYVKYIWILMDLCLLLTTICLTCGDKGETGLLIYCRNCQNSAIHYYCLVDVTPADDDIKWWCSECKGKDIIKAEPLRKSERISFKRQKALNMRNHWKQKLKRKTRLIQISTDIHETGQLAIHGRLPIKGLETNLVNGRQRDLEILERKSIPEISSNSQRNESIENEPTCNTNSNPPGKQEHNAESFDETREIPEFGNNEETLLLTYSDSVQNDGKDAALKLSLFVANNHPPTSDVLCRQPYLEPDKFLSADPIIAPVWRGWFKIKESEIFVEILAHISNKACFKVSDAAAALPPTLDVVLLDKHVTWPNRFRVAPPTADSIGLYFFPACERDERVYDSLLDEVIERELALKVMIDNVELLIFSSSELPLQHWRFNSKFFLWGVFKKMQRSSSMQRNNSTNLLLLSESTAIGNEEALIRSRHADHPSTPNQAYQSPGSLKSSQASNVPPSMNNTPESTSLELSNLDKTVGLR